MWYIYICRHMYTYAYMYTHVLYFLTDAYSFCSHSCFLVSRFHMWPSWLNRWRREQNASWHYSDLPACTAIISHGSPLLVHPQCALISRDPISSIHFRWHTRQKTETASARLNNEKHDRGGKFLVRTAASHQEKNISDLMVKATLLFQV